MPLETRQRSLDLLKLAEFLVLLLLLRFEPAGSCALRIRQGGHRAIPDCQFPVQFRSLLGQSLLNGKGRKLGLFQIFGKRKFVRACQLAGSKERLNVLGDV